MNGKSQMLAVPSISGHMINLGVGHSIAIYDRNGVSWIAEFRDGRGEFMYAGAWFRFHAAGLRYCNNRRTTRAGLQSATPLTPVMLESIERLHGESEAREERMLALPRTFAAAAQYCWVTVMSRLRVGASKISQTPG